MLLSARAKTPKALKLSSEKEKILSEEYRKELFEKYDVHMYPERLN